jgi:flagellar basal-body rod protein FlgF
MDRMIYTAMTGAKHLLNRQAVVANNLANANTNGFRAETTAFRVAPLTPGRPGEGMMTRYFAVESTPGFDHTPGPVQQTGRDLDVAIEGAGWLAVQADDGSEAYTRDGRMQINDTGVLSTSSGRAVLGEGGPITVPQDHRVTIGSDGTVSASPLSQPNTIIQLGKLKLVNPDPATLQKGSDGLVRQKGGGEADPDPAVRVATGALEGSNVNPVETMVSMIELARQFDMQMQLIKNADQNSQASQKLLSTG